MTALVTTSSIKMFAYKTYTEFIQCDSMLRIKLPAVYTSSAEMISPFLNKSIMKKTY